MYLFLRSMNLFYLLFSISLILVIALKAQVIENEFKAVKSFCNAKNVDNWSNRSVWKNINSTTTKDSLTDSLFGVSIQDNHVASLFFILINRKDHRDKIDFACRKFSVEKYSSTLRRRAFTSWLREESQFYCYRE